MFCHIKPFFEKKSKHKKAKVFSMIDYVKKDANDDGYQWNGRDKEEHVVACIYIVSRKNQHPRTLRELSV